MADTVGTDVLYNGSRRYAIRLTNISDGTGESAVAKVVKANLTNGNGVAPGKLSILYASWTISGFSSVRLFFDHTTPDEALIMGTGAGFRDFTPEGGFPDPGSAGGTGNITLTTAGALSGATYDIYLVIEKGN